MNINMKLPKELEDKIAEIATNNLAEQIKNTCEAIDFTYLIKEEINKQCRRHAKVLLESPELKSALCQKVYRAVDKELDIQTKIPAITCKNNIFYWMNTYIEKAMDNNMPQDYVETLRDLERQILFLKDI